MIKGRENQLKGLLYTLLFLGFFLGGCAHRNGSISCPTVLDEACQYSQKTTVFALNQTQTKHSEMKENSSDESLAFFDEDTNEEAVHIADPLSPWNRAMFHFNDKLYFWLLKPVSRGYKAVIPTPVRSGVKNFFQNITMPIRMVSCLLQGKGRAASAELSRFLINSTVGVLGFGNPAKRWPELNPGEEDLGQTLGRYGIGNGFYIVWPFFGPSTIRDSVGMVGDWFLNPVSYVDSTEANLEIIAVETVNETSFKIGDYESLKEAALDPYVALRNAYIQHRKKKVEE
ncbi:MAG: VacJ family lipoprotein [Deltaproteobacteria bacterium]|nr:VacJ family lipoprotein [Deltaproteobacteria bacterium]